MSSAPKEFATDRTKAGGNGPRKARATRIKAGVAQTSLQASVATDLPGWKIVSNEKFTLSNLEASDMRTDEGPSIGQLRAKFLGQDAGGLNDPFAKVDASVQTVRVQPRGGGPAKTADFKNGKVSIVQG